MIGLIVTEEIKQKNRLSEAVGSIITRGNYPAKWHGVENVAGGYQNRTDLHQTDGWYEVVQPTIGENQVRGSIFFDEANSQFTYEVTDLTAEQIVERIQNTSEANKEAKIQERLKAQVEQELQQSTDANEQLQNIDIFPLWEVGVPYEIGFKVKFVHEQELKLYRVEQAHTSQADWTPPQVPALFTRVAAEGEILPWVQPTGAQDAYQIGDIVSFDGQNWISTAANNVWQPGVFGWELYTG